MCPDQNTQWIDWESFPSESLQDVLCVITAFSWWGQWGQLKQQDGFERLSPFQPICPPLIVHESKSQIERTNLRLILLNIKIILVIKEYVLVTVPYKVA